MSRILLVDDEEALRKVLGRALTAMGHVVVEACNGKEALALHRLDPVELVVTDLVMPEKEGMETIEEFRLDYPGVGIVAMSGGGRYQTSSYLTLAKAMGADCVLAKPFSLQMLADAITVALAKPGKGSGC
jgi:CheY-like chemotaxis protein